MSDTFEHGEFMKHLYDNLDSVLVVIEDDQIGFIDQDYWIEINRINTPRDLVEWIHHLTGKNWITTEMIEQFIEAVCKYRKWKIYNDV